MAHDERTLLQEHGLVPAGLSARQWQRCSAAGNLLAALTAAWQCVAERGAGTPADQRGPQQPLAARLERLPPACGHLSWGLSDPIPEREIDWLGARLVWWPGGLPAEQRVAIVSSRLGRPVETKHRWFAALRTALAAVARDRERLVIVERTSAARYVRRGAALFGLSCLEIRLPKQRASVGDWLQQCLRRAPTADPGEPAVATAWLSPPLRCARESTLPVQDRVLFAAADRLFVCRVRPRGSIDRLLQQHFARSADKPARVSLAVGRELVPSAVVRGYGESPQLEAVEVDAAPVAPVGQCGAARRESAPVLSLDEVTAPERYLTHCTRHHAGPWPEQGENAYLDDLILGRPGADHSPLATLRRILQQRTLRATTRAVAGQALVVCFTAVPLTRLGRLRTYRPHRTRWDFEPYGICLDRTWLAEHGARPVWYGQQAEYDASPAADRPFFQLRRAGRRRQFDWSREQEWRHVGDVALDSIPSRAGMVFVPTRAEAHEVASLSGWPVIVLER